MANDVEELLRDGMCRATDEVRMAPSLAGSLTGQAASRRRRRQYTRAGLAAGTALAAVAGFAIAGPLTTSPARPGAARVQTVSYVIGQANHALTSMASGPALAQLEWTVSGRTSGAAAVATGWLYNRSPGNDDLVRRGAGSQGAVQALRRPSGQGVRETITVVNYQQRSWSRGRRRVPVPIQVVTSCRSLGPGLLYLSPVALRQLLACGDYAIKGHPLLDGVRTIELALVKTGKIKLAVSYETVWVNASTFLPVRVLFGPPAEPKLAIDLHWRPVTAGSLAHLKLSIPAGFKRVPAGRIAP
jgi:hypothetical protein